MKKTIFAIILIMTLKGTLALGKIEFKNGFYVVKEVAITRKDKKNSLIEGLIKKIEETIKVSYLVISENKKVKTISLEGESISEIDFKNNTITNDRNVKYKLLKSDANELRIELKSSDDFSGFISYVFVEENNEKLKSIQRQINEKEKVEKKQIAINKEMFSKVKTENVNLIPFDRKNKNSIYIPFQFKGKLINTFQHSDPIKLLSSQILNENVVGGFQNNKDKDMESTDLVVLSFEKEFKVESFKSTVKKSRQIIFDSKDGFAYSDGYKFYLISSFRNNNESLVYISSNTNLSKLAQFHKLVQNINNEDFKEPSLADIYQKIQNNKHYFELLKEERRKAQDIFSKALDKLNTVEKLTSFNPAEKVSFKIDSIDYKFDVSFHLVKKEKSDSLDKIKTSFILDKDEQKVLYSDKNIHLIKNTKNDQLRALYFKTINSQMVLVSELSLPFSKAINHSDAIIFYKVLDAIKMKKRSYSKEILNNYKTFRSVYRVSNESNVFQTMILKDGKSLYGLLDKTGRVLLSNLYTDIRVNSKVVITKNLANKYEIFNSKYKKVSSKEYDQVYQVVSKDKYPLLDVEELVFVKNKIDDKWLMGVFDVKKMKSVVPIAYDDLDYYSPFKIFLATKGKEKIFLNQSGKPFQKMSYSKVNHLEAGDIFIVSKDKKAWLQKSDGSVLSEKYDSLWPHTKYGLVYTRIGKTGLKDTKIGYINYKGKSILPDGYKAHYAPSDKEGYIIASKDGKYGVFNSKGAKVIGLNYDQLHQVQNGFVPARLKYKFGLIDINEKVILPYTYQNLGLVDADGELVAKLNDKWGLMDTSNKNLIPFKYDEMSPFKSFKSPKEPGKMIKVSVVKKGVYFCIVSSTGELLTECKYPKANARFYELIDKNNKSFRFPEDFMDIP